MWSVLLAGKPRAGRYAQVWRAGATLQPSDVCRNTSRLKCGFSLSMSSMSSRVVTWFRLGRVPWLTWESLPESLELSLRWTSCPSQTVRGGSWEMISKRRRTIKYYRLYRDRIFTVMLVARLARSARSDRSARDH